MKKHWIQRAIVTASLAMTAIAASAQLPFGKIELLEPTATVLSTDTIEVKARLTLDPNSPALNFSNDPLTGISAWGLPQQGLYWDPVTNGIQQADFARIDRLFLNASIFCGSFTNWCDGSAAPYTMKFVEGGNPLMPGLMYVQSFNLAPGASFDYTVVTFTPQAGGAPAGTYKFSGFSLTVAYSGIDAAGHALVSPSQPVIASNCIPYDPSCNFTRTVVAAVPEPDSFALMALGGVALAGWARRRRPTA